MKGKPERITDVFLDKNETEAVASIVSWNKAIDDYESFLPDKEELKEIIEKVVPDLKMMRASTWIAEEIAKRIGKTGVTNEL